MDKDDIREEGSVTQEKERYLGFDLGRTASFPIVDPDLSQEYVAFGGRLDTTWLKAAYRCGFFPFFAYKRERLSWSCPTDRFVLFTDEIHISHSMRNLIRKELYTVTFDGDFQGVIRNCATVGGRDRDEYAWIGPGIIKAYCLLHGEGYAHSVEIRDRDGKLVGGLYGVLSGRVFCGESMFSLVPSGSKLALIALAGHLREIGIPLIDCQYETPHLLSMGGRHIPYSEYIRYLGWG